MGRFSPKASFLVLKSVCLLLWAAAMTVGCAHECPEVQCPSCEASTAAPPSQTAGTEVAPASVDGEEQWVSLPFRITFSTSGNELDEQQRLLLREVTATLSARRDVRKLRVEGHTDSLGADAANEDLSLQRANAVLEFLVSQGVPRTMLEAVGYGATRPITSDTSELDRAQNRRVEFSILVVVPSE